MVVFLAKCYRQVKLRMKAITFSLPRKGLCRRLTSGQSYKGSLPMIVNYNSVRKFAVSTYDSRVAVYDHNAFMRMVTKLSLREPKLPSNVSRW